MKNLLLLTGVLLLFFGSACQKGKETARYPLKEEDLSLIPYELGAQRLFKHTSGFEFPIEVTQKYSRWETTERHHGEDYVSYEILVVRLSSIEPDLNITLEKTTSDFQDLFSIEVNRNGPYLPLVQTAYYDSLQAGAHLYRHVWLFVAPYQVQQGIVPDTILYTSTEGLIKIALSNEESFELVP